ncbi:hypothetical protein SPZE110945_13920 [Sphingomonas zeae]|jgi:hypothetical protein
MRSMVEGACRKGHPVWQPPSVRPCGLPPPRTGEDQLIRYSLSGEPLGSGSGVSQVGVQPRAIRS